MEITSQTERTIWYDDIIPDGMWRIEIESIMDEYILTLHAVIGHGDYVDKTRNLKQNNVVHVIIMGRATSNSLDMICSHALPKALELVRTKTVSELLHIDDVEVNFILLDSVRGLIV